MSQVLEARAPETPRAVTLPILATANDVRELVQFLKKRPAGVCVSDVAQPIKKRIFYQQKIAAYEFWGIVAKRGEHLKLSPLGWKFAESLEPEAKVYRKLLAQTAPYQSFLEELQRRQVDVITHADVGQYWLEHHPGSISFRDGVIASGPVVCFFHLCQAAELGTMTIGKRGQPARLRILRDELRSYLEESPVADQAERRGSKLGAEETQRNAVSELRRLRVYISVPENTEFGEQLAEFLLLNDIEGDVVARSRASESGIVSEPARAALKRCHAAIVVVTDFAGEWGEGLDREIRDSVLGEISAAYVLYDRRVVLLVDASTVLPPNLRDLEHCTYIGGTPTWTTCIELLRVIKSFRRP